MLKSMLIAFSMYSKIPVPKTEWNEKSMRYTMCFFPLVGVVIGALMYAAGTLILMADIKPVLKAAVMTVIPVMLTGGIHLDGFLDTMDAIGSWAPKEKRLEILKDSNSGAFAVIGGCVYFVLSLGIWSEMSLDMLKSAVPVFVLSRALSGLSVVSFPMAKNTGLAAMFSNSAHKRHVRIVMLLWIALTAACMVAINPLTGAAAVLCAAAVFAYYYFMSKKNFGGITGDLAGYFLQVCELVCIAACMIMC
ncbi:MAG: adenosylcobinamide-GDP ribazoletransferase [Monoglobales bacterium]